MEKFAIEVGAVFPRGHGCDATPFMHRFSSVGDVAHMECVVGGDGGEVEGCGMVGIEGVGAREGTRVHQRADVYFGKVQKL